MEFGYRLYDGSDGELHLDQIVAGRVYPLQPAPEDAARERGYYAPDFTTYLGAAEPEGDAEITDDPFVDPDDDDDETDEELIDPELERELDAEQDETA